MKRIGGNRVYNNDMCLYVAAFVRGARNFIDLSQGDFAKIVGCSKATIIRLESGSSPLSMQVALAAMSTFNRNGISCPDLNDFVLGLKDKINSVSITIDLEKIKSLSNQRDI